MAENRELALVLKLVADQFQRELKSSQGALSSFNSFLKDWKTQLTAAGTALFAIAKSTANFGEEALKGAQKAGQTVETFSALSFAAKVADVDQQQLIVGLKSLSQNMVEASRQTGDGEAVFRRLGVSALTAAGQLRPTEAVLLDLAEVFAQSADGAGKSEAAVKLFGKAGLELIPFLNQGKTGISDLMAEAARLGVVLSKEDAEAANRFNDEIKKLEAAMRGLTLEAGKPLIGVFTELLELFKNLTTNNAAQFFFRGLAEQAVLFTTLIKEAAANVEFLFGKFTFDQLRAEIARLEAEASAKLLLLENPAAAAFTNGPAGQTGSQTKKPEIPQLADQAKLGKELLELFLAQNRALDLQFDAEARLRAERLQNAAETLAAQQRIDEAQGKVQESRGRAERDFQVTRRALAKSERDQLVENLQAWVQYNEAIGASSEQRYASELDLLRANLAQQTELTIEETGRLLIAWQNHDDQLAQEILNRTALTAAQKETIELQSLARVVQANEQASDDIFAGWARGMERYVEDTKSGFGLGADMARRTAQAMEEGFRRFFFDLFEGRVRSLKDVLKGVLDFVKEIASRVAAQLALKAAFGAFGLGANSGGMIVQQFGTSGQVLGVGNRDTVPALLTPGEVVLSRRDVSEIRRGLTGSGGFGNLTVNVIGAPADAEPTVTQRRAADGLVLDVILRNRRDLRPFFAGS